LSWCHGFPRLLPISSSVKTARRRLNMRLCLPLLSWCASPPSHRWARTPTPRLRRYPTPSAPRPRNWPDRRLSLLVKCPRSESAEVAQFLKVSRFMSSDECPTTRSKKDLTKLLCCNNGRRKTERLPCSSFLTGSLFVPRTGKTLEVLVLNLSTKGVGVMALETIEVRQEGIILLKRTNATLPIPFQTRVIHCTRESECRFRIGCQFQDRIDSVLWEYLVGW